ncbi:VOC family protein [Pedobacter sp. HMF7647]|uniref:VOC family protein n=1 Tax=Hufsiella arboris TaxID=2695275 RepID=A0A7K1Y7S6_9SPHI|nr:glyoxalase superfamily protein [Hufsiella arboris]MXV50633.1 VOC family protein [Hufsiella arboris]
MAITIPILRMFDYEKAIEFYVGWLEFKIDWEDKKENTPIYMQISKGEIILNLSEHHGDSTPGSRVFIRKFDKIQEFHKMLLDKKYKFNRPGIETAFWNPEALVTEVIDPFGNRLTFTDK